MHGDELGAVGKYASTCRIGSMAGDAGHHVAGVQDVEPSDIRSATLLPSRAPSRISSVMMATASGWLSLRPLARRLRASSAAERLADVQARSA